MAQLHGIHATYAMPDRWVTMNDRLHPRVQRSVKNAWINACHWYGVDMIRRYGRPPTDRRLEGQVIFGTNRPNQRRDPMNWAQTTKWVWDGLVKSTFLVDDDAKHLIERAPGFDGAIHSTHFTIRLDWTEP